MASCGAMSKIVRPSGSTSRVGPPNRPIPATADFGEQEGFEPLDPTQIPRELREAIDRDELFVCYQPKLNSRAGTIDAVEALVRWRHPTSGLVPPGQFIGVAEETGLIADLTKWVVLRALADRERLQQAGHEITVHINLSGRLAPDPNFTAWILKAVEGAAPGAIGLEITASAMAADPRQALHNLKILAEAGLTITVDDYGSGPWSLASLKQLPARELKIDRAFISDLALSHGGLLLVRASIDLAHALEMQVTAVGVESPTASALLRMMGCDLIQGFVISPAVEIIDLEDFLAMSPDVQSGEADLKRFGNSKA